ncbi:hypothetical protein D6D03_10360 [Aureobasidium pullulans]|nr:hypothetical protein D6D03_10360 [Aureobasidium pullulans]
MSGNNSPKLEDDSSMAEDKSKSGDDNNSPEADDNNSESGDDNKSDARDGKSESDANNDESDDDKSGSGDNNSEFEDEKSEHDNDGSFEPEDVPEKICALFKQLNPEHIINSIKEVVLGDIEHLVKMADDRELDASTIIMLFDEAMKTRTGKATIIALNAAALVVCIVMIVFPLPTAAPVLGALGFTEAGPAAGSIAAACQSTFGTNAMFSTLQSAAMAGYGAPVIAGVVQGAAAAGATFASFNLFEAFDGF